MADGSLQRVLQALRMRAAAAIERARVRKVTQGPLERLQLESASGDPDDNIEHFGLPGFASATSPGADCVRVYSLGAPSHAIVIAVDDKRYRPADLAEGDACMYNPAGDRVYLKASRELVATINGATVTVSGSEIKLEIGAASITLNATSIALKAPSITLDP